MMTYQHWKTQRDEAGCLWAYLDKADSEVNTLDQGVLGELATLLRNLGDAKALIIASAKKTGFIAGADIAQFQSITNEDEGFTLIRYGQAVLQQLEDLPIPTIALIEGFCVGGGLELALACRYRIAEDNPKTRLGLPEVLLGIHPGWGGTVRLPRLIGGLKALPLILFGKTVDAKTAFKLGLVDRAEPKRQLHHAVIYILANPPKRKTHLTNGVYARKLLAFFMRKQLEKKVREEHYPAPYAALAQWEKLGVSQSAYLPEAHSIARLFAGQTARELIRVFFLQTQLKSIGKGYHHRIQRVHVVGAGTMGGDIAAWCALNGLWVTLQDQSMAAIAPAIVRARALFHKKKQIAAIDRLIPDVEGLGIKQADLIIEAIYENREAKQALFKTIEASAKPEAIFATNTSSIPLDEISQVLNAPDRLVGIHFFNPVAMMQLVEVVKGEKTDPDVVNKAIAFVKQIKKLPLPVKSSPGFLINRILMPYLMESFRLVDEGFAKEEIDEAAKAFGMPMGPIELADTVGLDVCWSVGQELMKHFSGEIPRCLQAKVDQKQLGKKTQQGFYAYKKGKPVKSKAVSFSETIQNRLIQRMLDEAAKCLQEGVVESADLLDAGMIFGTGFAPFRGGPMRYSERFREI